MQTLEQKRLRMLRELELDRPLVAGSLNQVARTDAKGRCTRYHLLTFKEGGKTRSVYVPKDLVKEVRSWITQHQLLKKRLAEISALSIAIIQKHVTEKRAAAAKRPAKPSSR